MSVVVHQGLLLAACISKATFKNVLYSVNRKEHWRHLVWFTICFLYCFCYHLLYNFVYTDTIVFLLIFSLGYLHLQSCHLDTFLRSSQSPIFKLQSLLTTLLEHEAEKKLRHRRRRLFASRHGSNFLHGCPFQVLVVLPFRSWNTTWDLETVYWVPSRKNFQSFPVVLPPSWRLVL